MKKVKEILFFCTLTCDIVGGFRNPSRVRIRDRVANCIDGDKVGRWLDGQTNSQMDELVEEKTDG